MTRWNGGTTVEIGIQLDEAGVAQSEEFSQISAALGLGDLTQVAALVTVVAGAGRSVGVEAFSVSCVIKRLLKHLVVSRRVELKWNIISRRIPMLVSRRVDLLINSMMCHLYHRGHSLGQSILASDESRAGCGIIKANPQVEVIGLVFVPLVNAFLTLILHDEVLLQMKVVHTKIEIRRRS